MKRIHHTPGESEQIPRVFTIVLNYNNYPDTVQTLDSVSSQDYPDNTTVLVENSTDTSIFPKIRSRFPDLEIVVNGKNLGYAGGNNTGIRNAIAGGADFIFVVNNDIILEPDVISCCVETMLQVPKCGACQPLVSYFSDRQKIWSAGTRYVLGYPRLFQKGAPLQKDGIRVAPYGLVGCAILFRTEAIADIGMFDESLFLLQEETDWCIRARKTGYSLLIVGSAVVYHKVSATLGQFSKTYLYYIGRNWILVAGKNFRNFQYYHVLVTELLTRFPYYLFCLLRVGRVGLIRWYIRGLADGIRGISGERTLE